MKSPFFPLVLALLFAGCKSTSGSESLVQSAPGGDPAAEEAAQIAPGETDETPLPDYTPEHTTTPVSATAKVLAEIVDAKDAAEAGSGLALAGADRYFFTVYGYQGNGPFNLPKNTHTWAVFIRVRGQNLATDPIEQFTISWDAADAEISLFMNVKPGHNYTLQETFALAANLPVTIRRTRIQEMNKTLWDKALARYNLINNGEQTGIYRYKMTDTTQSRQLAANGQPGGFTNCIHAVSDILRAANGGFLDTGTKRGYAASDAVYLWIRSSPYMVNPQLQFDAQLAPRLGI